MKISLVIPSIDLHFQYLDCVLTHYYKGQIRPNEVIVSLSNTQNLQPKSIYNLKSKFRDEFDKFILLDEPNLLNQGSSRLKGTHFTTGDLIVYSDSDDIPHPQRIAIIQHMFQHNDIVHLNHGFTFEQKFDPIVLDKISIIQPDEVFQRHFPQIDPTTPRNTYDRPRLSYDENNNTLPYGGGLSWNITGGHTSITKEVLKEILWRDTEDVAYDYDFCMDVLFRFNKSMIINAPLIWYNKINDISWAKK